MAQSPVLETRRCRLEPFGQAHLTERYVGWLNDPEVVRYSEQRHRRHDLASCRAYVQSYVESPHYLWAVMARDPALGHIGNINAYVDQPNATADLGILIGEKAVWGKGYGAEAWIAVCTFLFRDRGLRKLTAGTVAENRGMLGIMRKAGMREEGRRLRQIVLDGREVDMIYVGVFRDDFRPADP